MATTLVRHLSDTDILALALLAYANSLWDEAQAQPPTQQMRAFYVDSMERAKRLYDSMTTGT